uniref:Uncharacterized protein n=1 Tax=Macrostomum lignano TaxID=282301 RepID=A0A1I8F6F3_9PLAT
MTQSPRPPCDVLEAAINARDVRADPDAPACERLQFECWPGSATYVGLWNQHQHCHPHRGKSATQPSNSGSGGRPAGFVSEFGGQQTPAEHRRDEIHDATRARSSTSKKYIQVGGARPQRDSPARAMLNAGLGGERRRRRPTEASATKATPVRRQKRRRRSVGDWPHFEGQLVGLVVNGLPLSRIAAGEEAAADLVRLRTSWHGGVRLLLPATSPAGPGPTGIIGPASPVRVCRRLRHPRGPRQQRRKRHHRPGGLQDGTLTGDEAAVNQSRGTSNAEGGGKGGKQPQSAKIDIFIIVIVAAAGAVLLLVFFLLIYRCRSKKRGLVPGGRDAELRRGPRR